jgi:hypothetical protein
MDGGWGWEGNGLVPAATGGHSITLLLLIWVTSSLSLSLSLSPVCFWRTGNQSDFSQGNDWNSPSFLNFCSLLRAFVSLSWFGLVYFNLNSALVLVLPCALKFGHL